MRRYLFILVVLALVSAFPRQAHADIDIMQKIQTFLDKVQEVAKTVQEKIQEVKDQFKSASEGALKAVGDVQTGISAAQNGDLGELKKFGGRVKGVPTSKDASKDEVAEAVNETYVAKMGEGNDNENFDAATEAMQEILRNATSKLYALSFTTRTKMQKETPREVDMSDTIQIKTEVNNKSVEIVERLAQIYILESALKEYQFTQSLKNVTLDQSELEDEEK